MRKKYLGGKARKICLVTYQKGVLVQKRCFKAKDIPDKFNKILKELGVRKI